jgi:hypothetical protein
MPSERNGAPPTVLGGSLTRSPEGRLQTLQTHGLHTSPKDAQQVWSELVRRRYPRAWDRQPLSPIGSVIEWSQRIRITCGACRRSLGNYRGYHVEDEYGIVEDTPRRYETATLTAQLPGNRAPRAKPRFAIDGEIAHRAAKTTAIFHCPGCHQECQRNLARLGRQLMQHADAELALQH